jgi:hypothetical protein
MSITRRRLLYHAMFGATGTTAYGSPGRQIIRWPPRPRIELPMPRGTGRCLVCGWLPMPGVELRRQCMAHTKHRAHPTIFRL